MYFFFHLSHLPPHFPPLAWVTSAASPASSAAMLDKDADDAGHAGNVFLEMLMMQKRTRGNLNPAMLLRSSIQHRQWIKSTKRDIARNALGGVRGGVTGKEARSISYVQHGACCRRMWPYSEDVYHLGRGAGKQRKPIVWRHVFEFAMSQLCTQTSRLQFKKRIVYQNSLKYSQA